MRNTVKILSLLAAVSVLASCDTDELNPAQQGNAKVEKTFFGTQVSDQTLSKTYIEDGKQAYFKASEEISVFDGTDNNKFTGSVAGATTTFSGTAYQADTYYMLCPYQEGAALSGTYIKATMPSSQTPTQNTYAPEAGLSVAQSEGESFQLLNVIALLRVETSEAFTRIELKAVGGESLAGTATIDPQTGEIQGAVESGVPTITMSASSITAGVYYFAVLPTALTSGIQLKFYTSDNKVKTKTYSGATAFTRNKGLNCGKITTYDSEETLASVIDVLEDNSTYSGSFSKDKYQKALWMTTRFYGAQRMGSNTNNWLLHGYDAKNSAGYCGWGIIKGDPYLNGDSYIKDADGTYDLTGGWFDCGDFLLLGQTFYYSVYTLLLGYSEFSAGYLDKYSQDYANYFATENYTWESGNHVANGKPDILEECKWATDFILKAVKDESTFYYQKGGQHDHDLWLTSPTKSVTDAEKGGEYDQARPIYKASGSVTSMASLAGASLALMARIYKDYDATYAAECKAKALVAYSFVKNTTEANTSSQDGNYYVAKGKPEVDKTIFYGELYRLTGDEEYKAAFETEANRWISSNYSHNYSLCYNNTEDLGAYIVATTKNTYQSQGKAALAALVSYYKGLAVSKRLDKGDYSWGYLRYPANQAFVLALDNKVHQSSAADNNAYIAATIDYILGKNSGNFSYIVGFGDNFPHYPHHRNAYRYDGGSESSLSPITSSNPYYQLGMLVGGTNDGTYNDNVTSYSLAEGGIDYNAGLVGALAFISGKVN